MGSNHYKGPDAFPPFCEQCFRNSSLSSWFLLRRAHVLTRMLEPYGSNPLKRRMRATWSTSTPTPRSQCKLAAETPDMCGVLTSMGHFLGRPRAQVFGGRRRGQSFQKPQF